MSQGVGSYSQAKSAYLLPSRNDSQPSQQAPRMTEKPVLAENAKTHSLPVPCLRAQERNMGFREQQYPLVPLPLSSESLHRTAEIREGGSTVTF